METYIYSPEGCNDETYKADNIDQAIELIDKEWSFSFFAQKIYQEDEDEKAQKSNRYSRHITEKEAKSKLFDHLKTRIKKV